MEKIKKQVEELEGSVAAELARIAALQAQLEKERADFEERKEKIAKVHFASTIKVRRPPRLSYDDLFSAIMVG